MVYDILFFFITYIFASPYLFSFFIRFSLLIIFLYLILPAYEYFRCRYTSQFVCCTHQVAYLQNANGYYPESNEKALAQKEISSGGGMRLLILAGDGGKHGWRDRIPSICVNGWWRRS